MSCPGQIIESKIYLWNNGSRVEKSARLFYFSMREENMTKSQESNLYKTNDLSTAALLDARGHRLIEANLIGPQRLCFVFERRKAEDIDVLVSEHMSGQSETFIEAYCRLKALAFEKTGNLR